MPRTRGQNRKLLVDAFKSAGYKFNSKDYKAKDTLDTLKTRDDATVDRMLELIQKNHYSPEMLVEMSTQTFAKKQGLNPKNEKAMFKNAKEQKKFENKWKPKVEKRFREVENNNKQNKKMGVEFQKATKEEMKSHKGSFKDYVDRIKTQNLIDTNARAKHLTDIYSYAQSLRYKEDEIMRKNGIKILNADVTKQAKKELKEKGIIQPREFNKYNMMVVDMNMKMGLDLFDRNGFAVVRYMYENGTSSIEAMQTVVYNNVENADPRYPMPTEIPFGVKVTDAGKDAINRERGLHYMPYI